MAAAVGICSTSVGILGWQRGRDGFGTGNFTFQSLKRGVGVGRELFLESEPAASASWPHSLKLLPLTGSRSSLRVFPAAQGPPVPGSSSGSMAGSYFAILDFLFTSRSYLGQCCLAGTLQGFQVLPGVARDRIGHGRPAEGRLTLRTCRVPLALAGGGQPAWHCRALVLPSAFPAGGGKLAVGWGGDPPG